MKIYLKKYSKLLYFLLVVLVFSLMFNGYTFALFQAQTDPVINKFEVRFVNIGIVLNDEVFEDELDENFVDCDKNSITFSNAEIGDGLEKELTIKNINLQNYPTTDTYVRVRFVAIWRNSDGAGTGIPVDNGIYSIIYDQATSNWTNDSGSYYYQEALAPDQSTQNLTLKINPSTIPEGATSLEIQVFADGVMAAPSTLINAWGITVAREIYSMN